MDELDLQEVGARIKELRGRMTQSAFADLLGIERKTVGRYESGERAPDALALFRLMTELNADPCWVLTGKGFAPKTTEDERELLALFRAASLSVKAAAIGALQGGSAPATKGPRYTVQQDFHKEVGQQASGDIINKGKKKQ